MDEQPTTTYHSFLIENAAGVQDILLSPNNVPKLPDGWHMIRRQRSFDLHDEQLPVPRS